MGVLIVRHLQRALRHTIWVIILEQRQNSGAYTHALFYVMHTPLHPFSPIFVTIFTFLGLFPPQMVHVLPVPNMEWAVYELRGVPALGTPKTARVR